MTLVNRFRDPLVQLGILFTFSFAILFYSPALAASSNNPATPVQTVQSLEDTLFAIHYNQDTLESRVSRLEETVFGQKQSGASIDFRIQRLKSALSPASLGPLAPVQPSKADSMASTSKPSYYSGPNGTAGRAVPPSGQTANALGTSTNQPRVSKPEPGETDYPTVTQMELKRFSKSYTQEDITQRLNRLEQDVFKVPQKGGALADRVDNLKLVVLGDIESGPIPSPNAVTDPMTYIPPNSSGWSHPNAYSSSAPPYSSGWTNGNYGTPGDPYAGAYANPLPSYPGPRAIASNIYMPPNMQSGANYGQPTSPQSTYAGTLPGTNGLVSSANGDSPDVLAAISESEKQIIGHTYPSELTSARLERLETKVFKTTAPELPPAERIQRIIAVASAGSAPQSAKSKAKTAFQVLLPVILTLLPLILL